MKNMSSSSKVFFRRHGSTMLTVAGAVGVVVTAVTASKATTKVSAVLDVAKAEKGGELTKLEMVNVALPIYIPTLLIGVATIGCIFGANALNKRQQAALASSYAVLNESYKKYKLKVDELYGEGSDKEIEEAVFEDTHKESDETVLFYDERSKQFFESTLFKVQQAEYFLNRELVMKDYAYLNEWYELLDIHCLDEGWDLGWSTAACLDMYWQPWLDFNHSHKTTDDGKPYISISMWQEPIENFEDYF